MRTFFRRFSVALGIAGLLVASSVIVADLSAQGRGGGAPPKPSFNQPDNPLLRGFKWRSIGPAGQGARIDDFAVDEKSVDFYYVWGTRSPASGKP